MLKTLRSIPLLAGLLLALGVTPALGFEGHTLTSSFGLEGPGTNGFKDVQGVAVDQNSGDVYVYEDASPTGTVYRFTAAGEKVNFTGLATNAITEVGGAGRDEEELAVNSSSGPGRGDLYVANTKEVRIYNDTTGQLLGTLSGCGMWCVR